ncbi:MAG TPA: hypothetical protein GXX49_10185 [Clostridiaceae bacterium]|jgi:hypothetical protein|nr:hypothetical protein [Clostridiaceae bacterium]
MNNLLREIDKRLDSINFDKLWKGFVRYDYALYDDKNVYFSDITIPVDNRFLGNTSIEYDGKYIAIWSISDDDIKNLDVLAANIVHEMYHAHQRTLEEKRIFNDLEGLKYPYDFENYKLRYAERLLIAKMAVEADLNKKGSLFDKFISLRRKREKIINDCINYEKAIETFEGCAEYMALKALKVLSVKDFEEKINFMCNNLCKTEDGVFDTRRPSYFTGALICLIAEQLGLDIFDEIGKAKVYLYDKVANQWLKDKLHGSFHDEGRLSDKISLPDEEENPFFNDCVLKQLFEKYIANIKISVDKVMLNENAKRSKGEFMICGYDPMNMVRYDNMVLHKRFLCVFDRNESKFIKGPVVAVSRDNDYTKCYELFII